MDNIVYAGGTMEGPGGYREAFRERDMQWLANNLKHVPPDYLVVLATHAPVWRPIPKMGRQLTLGADRLFDVLKDRQAILAVNGHTHYNNHRLLGPEEGWHGDGVFHHMNIVTASGAWWSGPRGLDNIPLTPQRDGTPHGYVLVDFNGSEYAPRLKAIGKPEDHQMRIYTPLVSDAPERGAYRVLVNIFDGMMDQGQASFRINEGDWLPLQFAPQEDPVAERLYYDGAPDKKHHVSPVISYHMWEAFLEEDILRSGVNVIEVRYADPLGDGREFRGGKAFLHD